MSEHTEPQAGAWLTVAETAARLGMSERAVQRRCKSGKLTARQVEIPTGLAWLIAADSLPTAPSIAPTVSADNAVNNADSPDTSQKEDGKTRTKAPSMGTPTTPSIAPTAPTVTPLSDAAVVSALLAEKDARIEDLRATVEAQRAQIEDAARNAAELRAALREAQKIYAKALPSPGEDSPPTGSQDAPQRDEMPATTATSPAPVGVQGDEMAGHSGTPAVIEATPAIEPIEVPPSWYPPSKPMGTLRKIRYWLLGEG